MVGSDRLNVPPIGKVWSAQGAGAGGSLSLMMLETNTEYGPLVSPNSAKPFDYPN